MDGIDVRRRPTSLVTSLIYGLRGTEVTLGFVRPMPVLAGCPAPYSMQTGHSNLLKRICLERALHMFFEDRLQRLNMLTAKYSRESRPTRTSAAGPGPDTKNSAAVETGESFLLPITAVFHTTLKFLCLSLCCLNQDGSALQLQCKPCT